MHDELNSIGERLKYARKTKGFTQRQLADAIKSSRGVITNIEMNKNIGAPRETFTEAICNALRINKEWLIFGTGPMDQAQMGGNEILAQIHFLAQQLDEAEQDYILELIKHFSNFRNRNSNPSDDDSDDD